MEFDAVAYAATENLFSQALRAYKELPALVDEYNGHYSLHGGLTEAVGHSAPTDGQDALADNLERHVKLLSDINAEMERMNDAYADAESVVRLMEDPTDAAILRYRYLCGMPEHRIVRLEVDGQKVWQYSDRYIYERRSVALVRASAVVRTLGLVSKYS